jgi:hypothetical protein
MLFLGGETPWSIGAGDPVKRANLDTVRWRSQGLVHLPIAACLRIRDA